MRKRALQTTLLKKKVRLLGRDKKTEQYGGRAGVIVCVYLVDALPLEGPSYTVMLKDGRLIETRGYDLVVE
jgi:hypothetical protein